MPKSSDTLSNIAVIPARWGSKRVPHKNFKLLDGTPLFGWTLSAALMSKHIQKIIISTDYDDIDGLMKDNERVEIHHRSAELSGDDVTTAAVVLDVLKRWPADYVVTLPPTAPFRTADTIDKCVELFLKHDAYSVCSVTCGKVRLGGYDRVTKALYLKQTPMSNWPVSSWDNSSIYVTRRDVVEGQGFLFCHPENYGYAIETDRIQGHDINDMLDWVTAEAIIENGMQPC
jgi:CMP-N-acetylneuraminic acid synthetase